MIENHDKFPILISVSNPPTAMPGLLTTETGLDTLGSKGDDDESASSNSIQILDKSKFIVGLFFGASDFHSGLMLFADSKYLSNLNDINKSEQKSNVDTSKGFDWATEGDAGIGEFFFIGEIYFNFQTCPDFFSLLQNSPPPRTCCTLKF